MNETIELIKSEIYEAKSNLLKFTRLLKEEPKREGYSFYVTYFTNRLNILEQIKCELEAWEVVAPILIAHKRVDLGWLLKNGFEKAEKIIKALEILEVENNETL